MSTYDPDESVDLGGAVSVGTKLWSTIAAAALVLGAGLAVTPTASAADTTLIEVTSPDAGVYQTGTNLRSGRSVGFKVTATSATTVTTARVSWDLINLYTDTRVEIHETDDAGEIGPLIGTLSAQSQEATTTPVIWDDGSFVQVVTYTGTVAVPAQDLWVLIVDDGALGDRVTITNENTATDYTVSGTWSLVTTGTNYYYSRAGYFTDYTYPIGVAGLYATGSSPASSGAAATPTRALTLNPNGGTCTPATTSGLDGSWLQLPAASACTKAGSALLGWSTSPAFPVAVAQKQVDLGWGAIDDTFDNVRMIFIPAGGYTALTGDNTLHAIWA